VLQVNVVKKQITLIHIPSIQIPSCVATNLTSAGFTSAVIVDGDKADDEVNPTATAPPPSRWSSSAPAWHIVLATLFWLVSWFSYLNLSVDFLKFFSVVAVALALPNIALKGVKSLLRKTLDINFLMSLAVIGALGIQDYHEAATVVVVFSWSDWLEHRASGRARRALEVDFFFVSA